MNRLGIALRLFAVFACLPFLGCATQTNWPGHLEKSRGWLEWGLEHGSLVRVKPWEREVLALDHMRWAPDKLAATRRSHINFSKEASLIGGSAGGGGCGCN